MKHNTDRQVTMWQSDYQCPICGELLNTDGVNFYCPNRNCEKIAKERRREERRNKKNKREID